MRNCAESGKQICLAGRILIRSFSLDDELHLRVLKLLRLIHDLSQHSITRRTKVSVYRAKPVYVAPLFMNLDKYHVRLLERSYQL